MTFNELIKFMQNRGVSSLADIARELEVSPQSVSNWKARGQVPYKYIVYIQNKYNINIDTDKWKVNADSHEKENNLDLLEGRQYEESTISPMDIILPLSRYLKPIIITPTILCIVTILYVLFIAAPMYVSSSKFMSYRSDTNSFKMMGLASQLGIGLPMSESGPQWSYEEVIKGRSMAHKLLKHKFDTKKYGPQKKLLEILTYGNTSPKLQNNIYESQAVEIIQQLIKINRNTKTGVFTLEVSSIEPKLSSEIVHIIMKEMEQVLREYNANQNTKTREFIEDRLFKTKIELEASEEALKVFRQRNRNVFESPQLQLEQERLVRDVSVQIGVFTTLKQQLETAKIEEVKESDYLVILDAPEIPISPETPKKKLMVFLAGILGICLGVLLAFCQAYIQNSDSEEKEKMDKAKSNIYRNILELLLFKRFTKS